MDASEFSLAAVATLICFCAAWKLWLRHHHAPVCGIPMALQPNFILGHVGYMGEGCTIAAMKKLCVDTADGRGLASFFLFRTPTISVLQAQHVKIILRSTYRGRVPVINKHIDAILGRHSIVSLMHGEWKSTRKMMNHTFRQENMVAMLRDMVTVSHQLCDYLGRQTARTRGGDSGNSASTAIDVFHSVKRATLDIIGRTAFSYEFNSLDSTNDGADMHPVAAAFEFMLEDNIRRSYEVPLHPSSYFYSIPTAKNRQFRAAKATVWGAVKNTLQQRTQRTSMYDHTDLLQAMIDANKDQVIDEAIFHDNLVTFFFAGHDTTAIAVSYALHLLAEHPDVQVAMRSEVERVLGDATDPDSTTWQSLKLCQAVLKETLRLYPPAPLTTRTLEKSILLDGVEIPAGTTVWIPIWWVHRSPHNFDRPETFDPTRFMPPNNPPPGAWIPFSGGARNCVGQPFAMMEGTVMLAILVRRLRFSKAVGAPPVVPKQIGVVQTAAHGIWLNVTTAP
eukprot:m.540665 g.540665  ORF g.540665 m.540665 type:complete len:506 (+) comp22102_c0_seq22:142-1659(+)